ncbi:hypothetical protein HK405_007111, partial [Cladochytrium tenue]
MPSRSRRPRGGLLVGGVAALDDAAAFGISVADGNDLGTTVDLLPWRQVPSGAPTSLVGAKSTRKRGRDDQFAGGYLCLEEIDGVDVELASDPSGSTMVKFKKAKGFDKNKPDPARPTAPLEGGTEGFIHIDDFDEAADTAKEQPGASPVGVKERKKKPVKADSAAPAAQDAPPSRPKPPKGRKQVPAAAPTATPTAAPAMTAEVDATEPLPAWSHLPLRPRIHAALRALSFTAPTKIQLLALAAAFEPVTGHPSRRHVVGAAATGSGKTLAFGIPMVQAIAMRDEVEGVPPASFHAAGDASTIRAIRRRPRRPVVGLVVTPTRELAMQVTDHLRAIAQFTSALVVPLVGGMALEKQRRLLSYYPDIIVATPGRLWELAGEDEGLLRSLRCARFLAIDEADRMLEAGHFQELETLLDSIRLEKADADDDDPAYRPPKRRQVFIFSATLTEDLDLSRNLKDRRRPASKSSPSLVGSLVKRLGLNPDSVAVADASNTNILPETLSEVRVECLNEDKEAVLWYLLAKYGGFGAGGPTGEASRTIVFVNSIDSARKLASVLVCVGVPAVAIHADMQQRQRLRNLEKFRDGAGTVLVASDVAARGLDLPAVDHVIHFHLPRTAELYVHRSGRTARMAAADPSAADGSGGSAPRAGVSVLLCGPAETGLLRRLCRALSRVDAAGDVTVPALPVDLGVLAEARKRLGLARKIEAELHRAKRASADKDFLRKTAEAADL